MEKDIVIDSCVMRLYNAPGDPNFALLFEWIHSHGTLCISHPLINEYSRHGNPLVASLLDHLGKQNRLHRIPNESIKNFSADKKYKYLCNKDDIPHAKLTFISTRKKLVSFDEKLRTSVSKFKKLDGIKPTATKVPSLEFLS